MFRRVGERVVDSPDKNRSRNVATKEEQGQEKPSLIIHSSLVFIPMVSSTLEIRFPGCPG